MADVIGEVSRQIGSLRRQAAKALRYKRLHHRLRHLSLAWSGRQHATLAAGLAELEARVGSLRGAAEEGGIERVALIAPAVRIFTFVREDAARFRGRIAMFLGTEDDFCSVDEAQLLAADLGASLELFEGFEHYFLKGRRRLADRVVEFAVPELAQGRAENTEL